MGAADEFRGHVPRCHHAAHPGADEKLRQPFPFFVGRDQPRRLQPSLCLTQDGQQILLRQAFHEHIPVQGRELERAVPADRQGAVLPLVDPRAPVVPIRVIPSRARRGPFEPPAPRADRKLRLLPDVRGGMLPRRLLEDGQKFRGESLAVLHARGVEINDLT